MSSQREFKILSWVHFPLQPTNASPPKKKCFQNYKRNSVAITLPLRKEGFELLPFHRVRKIRNLKQTLSNDSYFYFTYLLFLGITFLHIFLQKNTTFVGISKQILREKRISFHHIWSLLHDPLNKVWSLLYNP